MPLGSNPGTAAEPRYVGCSKLWRECCTAFNPSVRDRCPIAKTSGIGKDVWVQKGTLATGKRHKP